MISLLTDTNDEEVRKAAIFVLQTCKKISRLQTKKIHEMEIWYRLPDLANISF